MKNRIIDTQFIRTSMEMSPAQPPNEGEVFGVGNILWPECINHNNTKMSIVEMISTFSR